MKSPVAPLLLIAALVILLRIGLEEFGVPPAISGILGIFWLLCFVFPIILGIHAKIAFDSRPYRAFLKTFVLIAVATRLIVMGTYSFAYLFQWSAPRFSVDRGGPVGGEVDALQGLLVIPATNMLFGLIQALVAGLIVGTLTLLIRRRFFPNRIARTPDPT